MSGRFLEISDRLAARAETYHRRKLRENASFRNPAVSNISRGSVSHYGYPSHYHTESHHDQKQDDPYMSMDNFTNFRSYGWKFHFYGIICHVPTKGRGIFNEQLGHFFYVAIFFLYSVKVLIQAFLYFLGFDFRDFWFNAVYDSILFSSPLLLLSNFDLRGFRFPRVFFCVPTLTV